MSEELDIGKLPAALDRLLPALESFWRYETIDRAAEHRQGWLDALGRTLPQDGVGFDGVIDRLASAVIPHGSRVGDPRFFGFITTGPTVAPVAASLAAAAAGGQRYLIQAFNDLEAIALRWLADLCGLPETMQGVFSSGGSTANLVALGAARQAAFEARGVDVGADGLPAGTAARIYASDQAHHTIQRSAAVLGMGRNGVVLIPTDSRQRMQVDALRQSLRRDIGNGAVPVAVVACAGTTDTGAVDPIDAIADVCQAHGVWLHVDGAYGLPAAAVPELAHLFTGVSRADSAIVDPHKWLATGVGVAATFCREAGIMTRAFRQGAADYLEGAFSAESDTAVVQFDSIGVPYADMGVELSAPPRGVLVWAVLSELGRQGILDRLRTHVGYAQRVTLRARAESLLEALTEPDLSIACFRFHPPGLTDDAALNALNEMTLVRLRRETPFVPSSTVVHGRFAIRPCFINPRTSPADVDGMVDAVIALGAELSRLSPVAVSDGDAGGA